MNRLYVFFVDKGRGRRAIFFTKKKNLRRKFVFNDFDLLTLLKCLVSERQRNFHKKLCYEQQENVSVVYKD